MYESAFLFVITMFASNPIVQRGTSSNYNLEKYYIVFLEYKREAIGCVLQMS